MNEPHVISDFPAWKVWFVWFATAIILQIPTSSWPKSTQEQIIGEFQRVMLLSNNSQKDTAIPQLHINNSWQALIELIEDTTQYREIQGVRFYKTRKLHYYIALDAHATITYFISKWQERLYDDFKIPSNIVETQKKP